MKKIFTLFIALFVMSFCAKAQVTFLNESFEGATVPAGWTAIDADGDGYNWVSSSTVGTFNVHSGDACITSSSYVNGVGALTPDNWLITPQLAVSAGDSISFWYRGQDATYSAEVFGVYVSTTTMDTTAFTSVYQGVSTNEYQRVAISLNAYAGQNIYVAIRHYNVTDMFWLNIDDVQFGSLPSTPTITATSDIDFGQTAINNNADQTVTVTAYSLTGNITVTTAAPFSVSADGVTYGTTATLTATTGVGNITNATLYVRYTPTTVGTDNGTMTIASAGATTDTVSLTGSAISCTVTSYPYNFGFDNDGLASCWDVVDANNDASTFTIATASGYAYYTYNGTNAADDYLISPEFVLTGNEMASFDYWVGLSSYPESFMVYALGTDTVVLVNTVSANNTSSAPMTQYVPLSNLTGIYRIAIKCTSAADQYRLYIDNFSVFVSTAASITLTPTSIDFGVIPVGMSVSNSVDLTVLNASNDITITTAAPFSVSLDNTTYSTSVTIPAPTTTVLNQTFYVAFAPTAANTANGEVIFSTTGAADTMVVTGTGVQCDVINQFPFVETFSDTSDTRACWVIENANNDDRTIVYGTVSGEWVAAYVYSSTNAANDYLISPEIQVSSNMYGHIDYYCNGYTEKFSVWAIPANGTIANAVNIVPTVTVTNTTPAVQNFDLSAYANQTIRVAIKVESDADQYYLFLDNFTVEELPSASLAVDPTSMTFSSVAGTVSSAQTANIAAYSLTNDITVSVDAPFEVSADGSTFGTSATIAQASIVEAPIYVRYAPTAVGTQNGTVTLTSGSLTATIALTGTAMDCSQAQALPFTEGFESDITECWLNIDNDGDGNVWRLEEATDTKPAHTGNYSYTSESYINYVGALTPDNWLITPALVIPGEGAHITWWVAAQDPNYPADYYEVKVSTSSPDMSAFSTVYSETISSGDWEERNVNLNYPGQTIYIAFVHTNCSDNFRMKIDDISVAAGVGINDVENNISIYPNPASSVLNVNANSNIQSVEVMNLMGQTIQIELANGLNTQINTSSLSNGVYMLRVTTENGVINQKFTVAR